MNSLRAVEVVARHLSYQGAAEELGVTPAAVKQLVTKLEEALGQKLVERDGRGLALTDVAKTSIGDLGLAMRHMKDAVKKMRMQQGTGRLIVSAESSLAATWLVPRLEDFQDQHPNVSVLIDSSQRIVDLLHSDVDVAIRYGVERDPNLITHRLFDDLVSPACSPSLASGRMAWDRIDQLAEAPLIHWDMSQLPWAKLTRRWFDWTEWAKQSGLDGFDATRGLRFSDYGLAVQAAISGQGFILASKPILQDQFDAGLLVRPFPNSSKMTGIGYDLVMTEGASIRPDVVAFAEWLKNVTHSADQT